MKNITAENEYAVEMVNISKSFNGVFANKNVSLKLKHSEIHALLGENGAGKSTLMNVLFGLVNPDSGEIKINGKISSVKTPNDASDLGIGMVHQHFMLIDTFTVLQNIILGDEPKKGIFVSVDFAREKVTKLMEKYGLSVDLDVKVGDITVGMQQRVEILKMLYRDNDILIFDEPTAVLTPQETDELLKTMEKLASEGCSILFITHHMDEIIRVADRCTILSQGRWVDTLEIEDTTKEELSRKMVGRDVKLTIEKNECHPGNNVLEMENVCVGTKAGGSLKDVSLNIREGEIVCIAGIDGNGQAELVGSVTGMLKADSGTVKLCGEDITDMSIQNRSKSGISHIPEDRLKHGIIGEYSVENNLILQRYRDQEFSSNVFGFLNKKNIEVFSDKLVKKFDIRLLNGPKTKIGGLSGGNQQKVVVAREMEKSPKLLVAVQPVRGVDVGATEYIHDRLLEQRDNGCAVLLVSFDLEEVMNLSDRILVMFDGEIVAEFKSGEVDANELGLYMAGGKKQAGRGNV